MAGSGGGEGELPLRLRRRRFLLSCFSHAMFVLGTLQQTLYDTKKQYHCTETHLMYYYSLAP